MSKKWGENNLIFALEQAYPPLRRSGWCITQTHTAQGTQEAQTSRESQFYATVFFCCLEIQILLHQRQYIWWHLLPVFLPGKSYLQRSLVGYSPWGCRVGHNWVTEHACYQNTKSFFKICLFLMEGIIAWQHCVGLCHPSTCISHRYTYAPSLLNLPPATHPSTKSYSLSSLLPDVPETTKFIKHYLNIDKTLTICHITIIVL